MQFTNLNSNSVAIMLAISSFYAFEKETSVQSEMHFGQCQGQTTLFRIEIVRMCVKIECDCKIVSKDNIDFYLLFEVFKAFFSHSNGIHSPVIVFNSEAFVIRDSILWAWNFNICMLVIHTIVGYCIHLPVHCSYYSWVNPSHDVIGTTYL